MFKLLLKDLKYYIISYLLIYPIISFFWYSKQSNIEFVFIVFVQVMIMGALIVLPPLFAEQDEDANNGYTVLQTLPLTKKEIIGAKFLLPVFNSLLLYISNLFIFSLFNTDKEVMKTVNSTQILTIITCLFIVGFVYIIVSMIGYANYLKFSSAFTVALAVLIVPVLSIFKVSFNELSVIFIKILNGHSFLMTLIIGLLIYSLLYIVTLKLDRRN